jgi:hypothetical protein
MRKETLDDSAFRFRNDEDALVEFKLTANWNWALLCLEFSIDSKNPFQTQRNSIPESLKKITEAISQK